MIYVIYGSGGHGRVVSDAISHMPRVFVDDNMENVGKIIDGVKVAGDLQSTVSRIGMHDISLVLAIGDNETRMRLSCELVERGFVFFNAIHPTAIISDHVKLGRGIQMLSGAIVNPGAEIGSHTIVNTGAIVEHDCKIGLAVHLAPRSVLGGGVSVGSGTLVGIGAVVLPYIKIGESAVIAGGAVVTKDVPAGERVAGVPARLIAQKK